MESKNSQCPEDNSFMNMKALGKTNVSPSSCINDLGTRSLRDILDWQLYMQQGVNSSVAIPGAAGCTLENFMSSNPLVDRNQVSYNRAERRILGTQRIYPGF